MKIGDVIVKKQVYLCHHVYTCFMLSGHVHPFLEYMLILLHCSVRILLKLRGNQALLSWLQNSTAFLGLDSRKSQLGMLYLYGEQVNIYVMSVCLVISKLI